MSSSHNLQKKDSLSGNITGPSTKFLLFGHGGYANHGCEAIVWTTSEMVKKEFPLSKIGVASLRKKDDLSYHVPLIDYYLSHPSMKRWTASWVFWHLMKKLRIDPLFAQSLLQKEVISQLDQKTIAISIGGDNYCYGHPYWLYAIDAAAKRAGVSLVLWGASIEPGLMDRRMLDDLALFDLIVARESLTYAAVKERFPEKPVYLFPDPAFTLSSQAVPLPPLWDERPVVGINVSPLLLRHESTPGVLLSAVLDLIEYILGMGKYSVALIPHVLIPGNNDLEILRMLFNRASDKRNLFLIDGAYRAAEYKHFISKCALFIGARTHATIAAYSSCVPPLVIGYSIKSRGVARDIFGDEETVLSVHDISDSNMLIEKFRQIEGGASSLREHLIRTMPAYIERAKGAAKVLHNLISSHIDQ